LTRDVVPSWTTGVLVLRASRREHCGTQEVEGRVRACFDVDDGRQEVAYVSGTAEINALVADWLARFAAGGAPGPE
jgi:hypothetical protein